MLCYNLQSAIGKMFKAVQIFKSVTNSYFKVFIRLDKHYVTDKRFLIIYNEGMEK